MEATPSAWLSLEMRQLSILRTTSAFWYVPVARNMAQKLTKFKIGSLPEGEGWAGVVHGSGEMNGHLMLIAWPYNGEILTTFRYST
jgi:hypothetical protein